MFTTDKNNFLAKKKAVRWFVLVTGIIAISWLGGNLFLLTRRAGERIVKEGLANLWVADLIGILNIFIIGIMLFGIAYVVFLLYHYKKVWKVAFSSWLVLGLPYPISFILNLVFPFGQSFPWPVFLAITFVILYLSGLTGGFVLLFNEIYYRWFYGGMLGCGVYLWYLGVGHLVVEPLPRPTGETVLLEVLCVLLPVALGGITGGLLGGSVTRKRYSTPEGKSTK